MFYIFNRYKRFISRFLSFSDKYNSLILSALQIDLYRGLPTHSLTGRGVSLPQYFLELHNVQHGEKDPVDGGTPTLMEVPVVPMRDRVSGFKQGLKDLI